MVMEHEVLVFDSLCSLMADSNSEGDKHVTLLDTKDNLKDYSLSKLVSLASMLIESLNNLSKYKENLK